jgi:hypothetical protein
MKNTKTIVWISILSVMMLAIGPAIVQAYVPPEGMDGYVRTSSGVAIAGATVTDLKDGGVATTNAQGYWSMPVETGGVHSVKAVKSGYTQKTISISINTNTGWGTGNFVLTTTFSAPYTGRQYTDKDQNTNWVGVNNWYQNPTVTMSTGLFSVHHKSYSAGVGSASASTTLEMYIQSYTPTTTKSYTVEYNWHVHLYAYASVTLVNELGSGVSEGYVKLQMNIYDVTSESWKFNGNQEITVWSAYNSIGGQWTTNVDQDFQKVVYPTLISGHQYQIYVKISTYTAAASSGVNIANTMIDLAPDGSDNRGGWLSSVNIV